MRFMPIEGVCYAGLEDISKLGKQVLADHFPTGEGVPQTTVSHSACNHTCAGVLNAGATDAIAVCSLGCCTSTGQATC